MTQSDVPGIWLLSSSRDEEEAPVCGLSLYVDMEVQMEVRISFKPSQRKCKWRHTPSAKHLPISPHPRIGAQSRPVAAAKGNLINK